MKKAFTRKEFLTTAGRAGCGLLMAAGALSALESCGAAKVIRAQSVQGKVMVPLSEFAEGSLRIVRVQDLQYDIALYKKDEATYHALLMRCSHQDWGLSASASGLHCTLHGSGFNTDGEVTAGPATEPLKKFRTTIENGNIIIT